VLAALKEIGCKSVWPVQISMIPWAIEELFPDFSTPKGCWARLDEIRRYQLASLLFHDWKIKAALGRRTPKQCVLIWSAPA